MELYLRNNPGIPEIAVPTMGLKRRYSQNTECTVGVGNYVDSHITENTVKRDS